MKPEHESKNDCFIRLAEARVNKLLAMFRLLGNLSHTGIYAYDKEQVEKIFTKLQMELIKAKMRFLQREKRRKKRFSLGVLHIMQKHPRRMIITLPLLLHCRMEPTCGQLLTRTSIIPASIFTGITVLTSRAIPSALPNSTRKSRMDSRSASGSTAMQTKIQNTMRRTTRQKGIKMNDIQIDNKIIDSTKLISKDEFLDRLFADGGTYMALTEICDENFHKWQTPLYWTYPISDGLHNGCYFILVKEGLLVISYDVIGEDEHEVFERESARMCTAEEMRYFIDEWSHYSDELFRSMQSLHSFLCRMEVQHERA